MLYPISILLPLYIYPLPLAWNWLLTTIPLYPSITYTLIINPSTGPGTLNSFPDSSYIDAIASLNAFDNVQLLGYVDTAYMHRAVEDVVAEVGTYNHWQTNPAKDIHMHGIFFDDCVSNWNLSTSQYMSTIASSAHQSNLSVTFNPGVLADPSFFSLADNILMIEDTYDISKALPSIDSIPTNQSSKSSVIFHHFTGSASNQSMLVKEILTKGINSLYITTANYTSQSDLWTQFLAAVFASASLS
ncbi:hypothetical protein BCIN_06g01040 [Botrytis cinerea B05.10]|uniref:Cell surface spherulin 4-like protein n=1 Tax=Botryotinia fuckeliana (strain B05.10) TaxID=332648 RepID=A0A384JJN7_BOTFB|nr:hypothetical protein BCIN_06g01040 [Botrytis cinerea B05.10]ATZ50607.1 hypothetical protein BCIN_06g01040 [Botrytis cinerea B05.10]